MKFAKSTLSIVALVFVAISLLLIVTRPSRSNFQRRQINASTEQPGVDQGHQLGGRGGQRFARDSEEFQPIRKDALRHKGATESPATSDGFSQLDALILNMAGPVTSKDLPVQLRLLDQWTEEGEEEITIESGTIVLLSGQEVSGRTYKAGPYDGIMSITYTNWLDPHVRMIAVELSDRTEAYEWVDGSFTRSQVYTSIQPNLEVEQGGGAKRWVRDWFASLWGG